MEATNLPLTIITTPNPHIPFMLLWDNKRKKKPEQQQQQQHMQQTLL
jgi:hypothetical protein